MAVLPPQQTIRFRTYLKHALVDGLQSTFDRHPDTYLQDVKVRTEWSFEEVDYPAVVVRTFITDDRVAGVGHIEYLHDDQTDMTFPMWRRMYKGTVEFSVYALSSLDRDLIMDSLSQILGMPQVQAWTTMFYLRMYNPDEWGRLEGLTEQQMGDHHFYHLTNFNSDILSETGESQVPTPWGAEDVLLYQNSYRVALMGEVLSVPADVSWTTIQSVGIFPYIEGIEPVPEGSDDPAPWIPDTMSR